MTTGTHREIRRTVRAMMLSIGLIALGGCMTIERGTTEKVGLWTNPPGATAIVDNVQEVVTPDQVELSRGNDHTVLFHMAGYRDRTETLTSSTSAASTVVLVSESLFAPGSVINAAVDWTDGASRDLSSKNLNVTLVALSGGPGAPGAGASPAAADLVLPVGAPTPSNPPNPGDDPLSESAGVAKRFAYICVQVLMVPFFL
jgi:hypothetical protein